VTTEQLSPDVTLHTGDCLEVLRTLPAESVNCCVTSPPYFGLRDYGCEGQIGLEETPAAYIARLVAVFAAVRRVLTDDGCCWVNLGDSYAGGGGYWPDAPSNSTHAKAKRGTSQNRGSVGGGIKPHGSVKQKDLVGIPWMFAFAVRDDGWFLRQDIIWHKPNPMPESVTDRCVKAHEYLFLLTKSARYWWDHEANQEPAAYAGTKRGGGKRYGDHGGIATGNGYDERTRRSVWTVKPEPYPEAHFATYPPSLIRPCIQVSCPPGGVVLDPFSGSGTTLEEAVRQKRRAVGIELNPEYAGLIRDRMDVLYQRQPGSLFAHITEEDT
jgi:DNA modification methylase